MKAKRGKCLALAAVLAMVVCAFAVAMPAGDSDAADGYTDTATVSGTLSSGTKVLTGTDAYYVTGTVSVSKTDVGEAKVYLAEGAVLTISSVSTGSVTVYLAKSINGTTVMHYTGLSFTDSDTTSTTYTAVKADSTTGAGSGISVASTVTPAENNYGVAVAKSGANTVYFPKGQSAGQVDLTAEDDSVTIVDGSAIVNGVYTTEGKTEKLKTITATDVVAADATKPVVIKVTIEIESSTTGNFTVSGGDVNDSTYTTGSISIDKNSFAIAGDDAAELVKVLKGYYTDGTVFARVGAEGAAAANITRVYGNVGNIDGVLTSTEVSFFNATCDVKVGSKSTDYRGLTLNGATVGITNEGNLNGITSGTINLTEGVFNIAGDGAVAYGAALTVSAGTTLQLNKTVTLNGTMNVYGKLTSTSTEKSTLKVQGTEATDGTAAKTAVLKANLGSEITSLVTIDDTGIATDVDISSAMALKYVSGTDRDPATYTQSQAVVLSDDYELTGSSAQVIIQGALVIPEGMTMTISNGASVTVDGSLAYVQILGSLEIEGGSFAVNEADSVAVSGTVGVDGTGKMTVNSEKFVVEDGAAVASDGTFESEVMTVKEGGNLALSGSAEFGIDNAGAIVLDEVTLTEDSKICLTGAGASVSVVEATMPAEYLLLVCDGSSVNDKKEDHANEVLLVGEDGTDSNEAETYTTISGLHLVMSGKYDSDPTKDTRSIDMSGDVGAKNAGDVSGDTLLTIELCGPRVTVEDSLTLGEGVKLEFDKDDEDLDVLTVSGTLDATEGTITKKKEDKTEAVIEVTGAILTGSEITKDLTVNAVYFKTLTGSHCYTTLAAALAAEADSIEVLGTVTITESAVVPSGTTFTVTGKLNVGTSDDTSTRDVVLALEEGVKAKGTAGTIDVYGSLAVAVVKDFKVQNVVSDVKVSEEGSALYTNIYTALAGAETGDIITITASEVTLDANITVAEGVVLNTDGKTLKVADGKQIVITVDGTVIASNGIGTDTTFTGDKKSTLKVTGELLTSEGGKATTEDFYVKYQFAGAYYTISGSDGTWTYITTLENAVEDAQLVEYIDVFGKVTVGDIEIVGADADSLAGIHINSGAVLTAGTIDLDNAVVGAEQDASVTATVAGLNGSVSFKNIGSFAAAVIDDDAGVGTLYIAGAFKEVSGDDSSVVIASGSVVADADSDKEIPNFDISGIDSFTIAESATLLVDEGTTMKAKNLTVAGTLEIDNGGALAATGNVFVTGALTVDAVAANKSAGTVSIDGVLVIGYAGIDLGAAAELSAPAGAITAKAIYVVAGSTVSADAVKDLKHTSFYVAGTERFTVYTSGTIAISDIEKPKVAGADVIGWDSTKNIGDVEKAEAIIDYEVYALYIVADYGFADIYVDGAKVASVSGGKVIYVNPDEDYLGNECILLRAGTHTVEYTLKSGYSGDKVTTSFNGKEFSKTFSITTDMDWEETAYKMVLAGVTQSEIVVPEPEKKDSTLTDALLIVLVVLIAVMAIMVALKLMRS